MAVWCLQGQNCLNKNVWCWGIFLQNQQNARSWSSDLIQVLWFQRIDHNSGCFELLGLPGGFVPSKGTSGGSLYDDLA